MRCTATSRRRSRPSARQRRPSTTSVAYAVLLGQAAYDHDHNHNHNHTATIVHTTLQRAPPNTPIHTVNPLFPPEIGGDGDGGEMARYKNRKPHSIDRSCSLFFLSRPRSRCICCCCCWCAPSLARLLALACVSVPLHHSHAQGQDVTKAPAGRLGPHLAHAR